MLRLSLNDSAFGLDLSERSLKYAALRRRGQRYEPIAWGEQELPAGLFSRGDILDPAQAARALRQALRSGRHPIRASDAVVCLPEQKTFLTVIRLPMPADAADLDEQVRLEASRRLPTPLAEVYLDWQVLGEPQPGQPLAVAIAAAPRPIVDAYTALLEEAGLNPIALEVEGISISRALQHQLPADQATLVIDLGAARSSLLVYDYGTVQFSSSQSLSGLQLTAALAAALRSDGTGAEALKRRCGLLPEGAGQPCPEAATAALSQAFDELIRRSRDIISYYAEQFPHGHRISGLIICGGGALLPGLEVFLQQQLELPVQLGTPTAWLAPSPRLPQSSELTRYCTAIGLALRAASGADREP